MSFAEVVNLLSKKEFKKVNIDLSKYPDLVSRKWLLEEIKS